MSTTNRDTSFVPVRPVVCVPQLPSPFVVCGLIRPSVSYLGEDSIEFFFRNRTRRKYATGRSGRHRFLSAGHSAQM